jgi:hypothetical protein
MDDKKATNQQEKEEKTGNQGKCWSWQGSKKVCMQNSNKRMTSQGQQSNAELLFCNLLKDKMNQLGQDVGASTGWRW